MWQFRAVLWCSPPPLELEEFAKSGISHIEGSLTIGSDDESNPVTSLLPLGNLTGVEGELIFKKSVAATDLLGLENLEYAGSIQFHATSAIKYIALPSLREVSGGFTLPSTVCSLVCPMLEKTGGPLSITAEYTGLFEIDLHRLRQVDGDFTVTLSSIPAGKDYELYMPALEAIGAPSYRGARG
ncbi:MAG: hypothetical protein LUE10_05765 [Alistipes sp.]|nr:hypothetical protein [Alistipes sp.]